MNEYCEWNDEEDEIWWTSCGQIQVFMVGNIKDNQYVFCPYCGRKIKSAELDEQ